MIKYILLTILLLLFGCTSQDLGYSIIPVNLQLKTDKANILGQTEDNGVVKYAYKTNVSINNNDKSEKLLKIAKNSKLKVKDEILEKRTKHSRSYKTDEKFTITEFVSGVPQYYEDENGDWWQAEYGTTTKEVYEKEMEKSLISIIFGKKALATDSTFYPDANSVDGHTRHVETLDWGDLQEAVGNRVDEDSTTHTMMGLETTTNWRLLHRGHFLFDTSAIGTDEVSAATLSLYGSSKCNIFTATDFSLNIYSSNPAADTELVDTDHSTVGSTTFSTAISYGDWAVAYNNFILNSSGITAVVNGISKFSSRGGTYDGPDVAPDFEASKYMSMSGRMSEQEGTDEDPKLFVVHAPAAAPPVSGVDSTQVIINNN